jgi:DNA polymerase-4
MPALCRDCLTRFDAAARCPACRSPRVLAHPELTSLSIAHMDCDAFYASVEKRDNPGLRDHPVIVGGGTRGVVSTCCYLARIHGVRSAMPMFQALKLCPQAIVVKPRMAVYVETSRAIRALMEKLTPAIEPLSLDEAFLDLTGTERLHGAPPAVMLAKLLRDMETDLGLSGSIGLSHNKFLAKIASDLDKPRGFSVIGRAEPETRPHHLGRRHRHAGRAGKGRHPHHRRSLALGPRRPDRPLRPDGRQALAPCPRPRHPPRQPR